MRWANKIMSSNQDQSQSKLSNRSLSKFRKVNLQRSELEISSTAHLEKSVLKLTSVQKIKTPNLNRSFISSYVMSNHPESKRSSRQLLTQNQNSEGEKSKDAIIPNLITPKSGQFEYPKILDFCGEVQGYGIFQREADKAKLEQQLVRSSIQMQNPQQLTNQQRLKRVLVKIQQAIVEFKEVSQNIQKSLNQAVSSGFAKLQNQLAICVRQFQTSIQSGIQQMIKMITKQKRQSRFKTQNFVHTNQIHPPSPSNDSFYQIGTFQQEKEGNEALKHPLTSRPNKFKNQFKQIIDESNNQNIVTKHQFDANVQEKSTRKIVRKQTNPVNRVNSFAKNDSSLLNEDSFRNSSNISSSSIRYSRINERSASKSVKKLHQKLVLIKNIFNAKSPTSSLANEQIKILVPNNS